MLCQACNRLTSAHLICEDCRRRMRPAPDRVLPGGVRLVAAFEHSGPARALVHHLKYRGLTSYADVVAAIVAPRLPGCAVVPVPRALSRRLRYGVDGAQLIAEAVARRLGTPVVKALAAPLHAPRRAGGDHAGVVHPFRLRRALQGPVLVVDDVVTTGSTLLSAVAALGPANVAGAVAANSVAEVSSLLRPEPSPGSV